MPLAPVDSLSDDDVAPKPRPVAGLRPCPVRRPRRASRKSSSRRKSLDLKRLHYMIKGRCGCQSSCFQPFVLSGRLLDTWIQFRRQLFNMTKLEKDKYVGISVWLFQPVSSVCEMIACLGKVFDLMKVKLAESRPELGIRHLAWQGHPLCNRAS